MKSYLISRLVSGEPEDHCGYADALKIVWVTMCGLSALGFVLSLWTKGLDLNKPLETEQGMQAKSNVDEEKR